MTEYRRSRGRQLGSTHATALRPHCGRSQFITVTQIAAVRRSELQDWEPVEIPTLLLLEFGRTVEPAAFPKS